MNKAHSSHHSGSSIDIYSEDSRKKLARMIMNLFDLWELDSATKLNLLGLSSTSRALLGPYKNGTKPLPNSKDLFDRASFLLSIHKSLRLLYPKNEKFRRGWVKYKNLAFGDRSPLEIMIQEGIIGLSKVARYLEFERGR